MLFTVVCLWGSGTPSTRFRPRLAISARPPSAAIALPIAAAAAPFATIPASLRTAVPMAAALWPLPSPFDSGTPASLARAVDEAESFAAELALFFLGFVVLGFAVVATVGSLLVRAGWSPGTVGAEPSPFERAG